jgi:hypothetical protein
MLEINALTPKLPLRTMNHSLQSDSLSDGQITFHLLCNPNVLCNFHKFSLFDPLLKQLKSNYADRTFFNNNIFKKETKLIKNIFPLVSDQTA